MVYDSYSSIVDLDVEGERGGEGGVAPPPSVILEVEFLFFFATCLLLLQRLEGTLEVF